MQGSKVYTRDSWNELYIVKLALYHKDSNAYSEYVDMVIAYEYLNNTVVCRGKVACV